jgi:hypothetical protein
MDKCNCTGCELKSLFFQNVNPQVVESICDRKVQYDYKKGEVIIREGEVIKDFYANPI